MTERTEDTWAERNYEDRAVAFVDVLGFQDLLNEMDADPEIYGTVMRSLYSVVSEELRVRWGDDPENEFRLTYEMLDPEKEAAPSKVTGAEMTAFSDCFVVSERVERLPYLIARTHRLAVQMLLRGIVSRGGIVLGRVHHRYRVAFGPGIVDAYRLEQGVAKYPRIVVHRAVADAYLPGEEAFRKLFGKDFGREVPSLLDRDVDGCWFINPFVEVPERAAWGVGMLTPRWERVFRHIGSQLVKRLHFELQRGIEPHIAKIRWLVYQFNRNMQQFIGNVPLIHPDKPR